MVKRSVLAILLCSFAGVAAGGNAQDTQPPVPKNVTATPEAIAKGKAIMAAALKALGGDAVKAVKDLTMTNDLTLSTPDGEFSIKVEGTINLSGKLIQKMATPMGEVTQGFDGTRGWIRSPQGVQDAPESTNAQFESGIFGNIISLLVRMDAPGIVVQAIEASGGLDGVAIADSTHNLRMKFYFDPKTGLPAKKIATGAPLGGPPGEEEDIFDDYRDVSGIMMPYHAITLMNGKKVAEMKVISIKINPGVEEAAYRKP